MDKNEQSQPNIVETYQLGNTTVHIADDAYRGQKPDEVEQVWKDFYATAWAVWNKLHQEEGES
jgi:hypothetical protein